MNNSLLSTTHHSITGLASQSLDTVRSAPPVFTWPEHFPELASPRLVLRRHRPEDLEAYFALYRDPAVCEYDDGDPLTDLSEASEGIRDTLAAYEHRDQIRWAISLDRTSPLIGSVGIYNFDADACRCEIGYDLMPAYWNRGYMSEAADAVCRFAFDSMGMNRIEAQVSPGNIGSCRMLAKCRFVFEGHLRQRDFFRKRLWDSLMHSRLRDD